MDDIIRLIETATNNRVRVLHNQLRGTLTLIAHSKARAFAAVYAAQTHPLAILRDIEQRYVRWLPWTGTGIDYTHAKRGGRALAIKVNLPSGL